MIADSPNFNLSLETISHLFFTHRRLPYTFHFVGTFLIHNFHLVKVRVSWQNLILPMMILTFGLKVFFNLWILIVLVYKLNALCVWILIIQLIIVCCLIFEQLYEGIVGHVFSRIYKTFSLKFYVTLLRFKIFVKCLLSLYRRTLKIWI